MESLKQHFITSSNQKYKEGKVTIFEQNIVLEPKQVTEARLTMTALGIYEAEIDQVKVGEQLFAPGFTYYPRELAYQTYDVTELLHKERLTLKVYLGQGWYNGRFTHENKTQIYGDSNAVSWELVVVYSDGCKQTAVSDTDVIELASPYEYAGFYDGERYDGSKKQDAIGKAVKYRGTLQEDFTPTAIAVKLQEAMLIKAVILKEASTILDFGQNFAGILEIDTDLLPDGATVKIRHGELLVNETELYTENLRKAKAEIVFKKGEYKGLYRPKFTYMGFRYAEISGAPYTEGLITARALYSDMVRTGQFRSGNPLVDRLYQNQLWGQKSNFVEVPTDCPQRDERMGYTGDGQVFALTGSYNFDTEKFFGKFLKDIRYSQLDNEDGYVGATIPADGPGKIGLINMLGWGNAVTIIPEMLYWQFGNKQHLIEQYASIKTFVDAEIKKMGDQNLWLGVNLGDWLMPGKDMAWMAVNNGPVSNSFIVHDLEVLADLAKTLGYVEDAVYYSEQLTKTRAAYIQAFVSEDGTVSGNYQGAYIMALKYVIQDGDQRARVLAKLVKNVEEYGLNTGFFSTEFLLPLLIEANAAELAYDILLDEGCPGWMYQIKQGATTIWERWDALREDGSVNESKVSSDNMVSFNHYAFGSVGRFYYQYILGIQPIEPGYKRIRIKPYPDLRLKNVEGSYLSRSGEIKSSWRYLTDEEVTFEIETPVEAVIELPDGTKHEVSKGKYTYTASSLKNRSVEQCFY